MVFLIKLRNRFDVIGVVLIDNNKASPTIYGIQISRSLRPFEKHHTFDTCQPRGTERLGKLWRSISDYFKLDDTITVKKFYVMLAPYCEKDDFQPPAGHSSDYYISTSVVELDPSISKQDAVPSRSRSK